MKSNSSTRQDGKLKNLNLIFTTIAKSRNISRIDIANRIGLSASAVSGLTDDLIFKRLIVESGPIESGEVGRRAIMLKVNPFGGFFVCVMFKAGKIQIDVFNLETKCDFSKNIPVNSPSVSGNVIINAIEEEVQYNYKYGKLFGIALIMPSWYQKGQDEEFKKQFGYGLDYDCFSTVRSFYRDSLVIIEKSTLLDAYCQIYDDFGGKNILCLSIDNNIYSSLILNGEIYRQDGANEEFGNIGVDYEGGNSSAKKRGVLSSFVSADAICNKVSQIKDKSLSFENVIDLYNSNDSDVSDYLNTVADIFAYAISSYVDILGLDIIVVQGLLTGFGKKFADTIFNKLSGYISGRKIPLFKFAEKGNVMQGGAFLLFDKVFCE